MKSTLLFSAFFLLLFNFTFAGSATWSASPKSGTWSDTANWMPHTVPKRPGDVAAFGVSDTRKVFVTTGMEISEIVFNAGADVYDININNGKEGVISGTGITNLSGTTQIFSNERDAYAEWRFINSANAGDNVFFNNNKGGEINFYDTASAGDATFSNHGPHFFSSYDGALTQFYDNSTAGTATFINRGGYTSNAPAETAFWGNSSADHATILNDTGYYGIGTGGRTAFFDSSTAADATFVNRPGGWILFLDASTAANAVITNEGQITFDGKGSTGNCVVHNRGEVDIEGGPAGSGTIVNTGVSATEFLFDGDGGNCTIIARGGPDGGPAPAIYFFGGDGGNARMELFGDGNLDISEFDGSGTGTGSIEGNGVVFLGGNNLAVGKNGRDTTFSGLIRDGGYAGNDPGGSLTKVGPGTLTLSGSNTYTGRTTVEEGELAVTNQTGSSTGPSPVQVNAGTLSGDGIIAGAVTLGTGGGAGAFIRPGETPTGTLTVQSSVLFNADAIYDCTIDSTHTAADQLVANGVTINTGALFSPADVANQTLPAGTTFTVLNNTATTPIGGVFANLTDGGTIAAGSNSYRANYDGGDGNDLTLTVVE